MRILLLILTLAAFIPTADAQVISVNASATVPIPANQINFHITINAEGKTSAEVYDLHKKREKVLVTLLTKHQIKEKNINFEPISITKTDNNRFANSREELIVSRQNVVLSLNDFDIYEQIQITLIENDFDEFNASFTSTETKEGETEALKKALNLAREKANIIAENTGLSITGIKEINYSYNHNPPHPRMEMQLAASPDNLLEFDQTVSVSASVSITYTIQ